MFERLRRSPGDEGFTLIELLIVIVILGVLAAIVIFAVGAFTGEGELEACKTDAKNVETAAEAFKAQNGNYPGTVAALVPNYLREAPPTDPEDEPYFITYNSTTGGATCSLDT